MFRERCLDFYRDVLQKNEAKIISQEFDYSSRTIRVVMLGEEVDSVQIAGMAAAIPLSAWLS